MAQQTAVEWLVKEFNLESYEASVKFALEKEKEQIKKAYYTDCVTRPKDVLTRLMPIFKPFENYFKETYDK